MYIQAMENGQREMNVVPCKSFPTDAVKVRLLDPRTCSVLLSEMLVHLCRQHWRMVNDSKTIPSAWLVAHGVEEHLTDAQMWGRF